MWGWWQICETFLTFTSMISVKKITGKGVLISKHGLVEKAVSPRYVRTHWGLGTGSPLCKHHTLVTEGEN